jgi:hypothetical protein
MDETERPDCFGRHGWRDGITAPERHIQHRMRQKLGINIHVPAPCAVCPHRQACSTATRIPEGAEVRLRPQGPTMDPYVQNYYDAKDEATKEQTRTASSWPVIFKELLKEKRQ